MTRSLRAPASHAAEPDESADLVETSEGPSYPEGLDRFRIVLAAAMGTVIVTYAMLVPAALLVVLAGGGADGSVDGAFAAAIPLWLAAHLIPLELEGQPLSVLPLFLPLAVVAVVSVGARWAVRRLGGRFRHDAGAVIAATAGAHAAVAVLGSALLPSATQVGAAPWAAMVGAGLVAAVGAVVGVLRGCGLPDGLRERLPGWPAAGLAGAAVGGMALVLVGGVTLLVGLIVGASRAHAMFEALTPTTGGALGLTLLSLAYLPNAVLGGAAWLLGPGVDVGLGAWTPFGGAPGPLPPFPLLAALPTVASPAWAVAVVVVPVAVGLLVGGTCRSALGPAATTGERLRAVGAATGTLVVAAAVLALLAGGRLSAGDFDPVAIPLGSTVLAVAVWIGGPAAVVALVQRGGAPEVVADEELGGYRDGWSEESAGLAGLAGLEGGAVGGRASDEPAADVDRDGEWAEEDADADLAADTDTDTDADTDTDTEAEPAPQVGSDPEAAARARAGTPADARSSGGGDVDDRGAAAAAGPRGRRGRRSPDRPRRGDGNAAVEAARRRREARLARGSAPTVPEPRADDSGVTDDQRSPSRRRGLRGPAREETVAPEPAVEIVPEPASAQDSEPAPRTVGELVALRKRQAEAAAAGTEAPETPPADD